MKKIKTYLIVSIALLLSSCSNEEILPLPDESKKVEMPVSIEITSGKKGELETRATSLKVDGTCDVDKIRLLVYSGDNSKTDRNQLIYESETILNCQQEGDKWVARGSVTGTVGENYSIFALGYNDTNESSHFIIENNTTGSTYGNAIVKLVNSTVNDYVTYTTPELFAGNVHPKGENVVFTASGEEQKLTGTLYRAVGKCSIRLTGVPANIKKITWLTEKFADTNIFFRKVGLDLDKYPMGTPTEDELRTETSKVASIENNTNEVWDATLSSFFIPLTKSLFYIDALDSEGNTTRYLVKCADKWSTTIWLGILTYYVESYRFSTYPNFQMSIEGTFEKLKNSGNLLIDLSPMEEFDGGLLS